MLAKQQLPSPGTLSTSRPVITSQLHGSEAEGPKRMPIRVCFGPLASLPCSCDVITVKVYLKGNGTRNIPRIPLHF